MELEFGAPSHITAWVKRARPLIYTSSRARQGTWTIRFTEYRYGPGTENPSLTPREVVCHPSPNGWTGHSKSWRLLEESADWKEVDTTWFMEIYPDGTNGVGMGLCGYQHQIQGIDFEEEVQRSGQNTFFFHEMEPSPAGSLGICQPTQVSFSWALT